MESIDPMLFWNIILTMVVVNGFKSIIPWDLGVPVSFPSLCFTPTCPGLITTAQDEKMKVINPIYKIDFFMI